MGAWRPWATGRPRTGRGSVRLALAAAALALAACGIPTSATPRAISPAPALPALQPPGSSGPSVGVNIYLLGAGGALVRASRILAVPASMSQVIEALLKGPTNSEAASGISTALNSQAGLLNATVDGTAATVDFKSTFSGPTSATEQQAVSQVVFTATAAQKDVNSVYFEVGSALVTVPTPAGPILGGPVTKADFAPPPPTTTTTARPGAPS